MSTLSNSNPASTSAPRTEEPIPVTCEENGSGLDSLKGKSTGVVYRVKTISVFVLLETFRKRLGGSEIEPSVFEAGSPLLNATHIIIMFTCVLQKYINLLLLSTEKLRPVSIKMSSGAYY